jgi:hypothetical protein
VPAAELRQLTAAAAAAGRASFGHGRLVPVAG